MSTFVPSGKNVARKWYVVDADGQTLGRLATKAASVLSGKLNPQYVPYIDMGDHVIVIKSEQGLPPLHRLSGRPARRVVHAAHQPQAREGAGRSNQGHAAQDQAGPRHGFKVEGVPRRQAPPRGSDAGGIEDCVRAATSRQLLAPSLIVRERRFEGSEDEWPSQDEAKS